jgi:hypothetical protein
MIGSNTRDYRRDTGDKLYRRSLYTFWKRAAPPASMEVFNAPSRETCTVRRERTNTPLQALVLLNDPTFVEASRKLAERCLTAASDRDSRIDLAFRFVEELNEAAQADAEVFEGGEVDAFPELGGLEGAEVFELLLDGGDRVFFLKAGGDPRGRV